MKRCSLILQKNNRKGKIPQYKINTTDRRSRDSDITQELNSRIVKLNHISVDDVILDFGPETMGIISKEVNEANKILWNGPLGVFEKDAFSYGTRSLAELIKDAPGYTIAGGGIQLLR